eukprot:6029995-Amphidinium_carterae.1
MDPKESLGDEAKTTYWSLLGGVAWLKQTRPDICVMVHALQRVAHNPSKEDAIKLNSVLKYAKRKPLGLRYPKLPEGQMKLHLFSDATYKVQPECTSGLSVRGSCLALMSTQAEGKEHLAGHCHLLKFQSVKQKRVTRSTYAAELNGLADSLEQAVATRTSLIELLDIGLQKAQCTEPAEIVKVLRNGLADRSPALAAYTDARSVYDSIVVPDFHLPTDGTEASQGLVLLSLRDEIRQKRIEINWVDTRWMLAGALTKGSVSREQIVQASGGVIELPCGSLVRYRTI